MHAELSLVVCTYGRDEPLWRLFASLRAQTWRNFEILLVDQNEDDRVLPAVRAALADGLQIRHLRSSLPNLSAARNCGIAAARGEWLGFPDDDCWYEPDTLACVMAGLARQAKPSALAARWFEFPDEKKPGHFDWQRSIRFRDRMLASFMLFFHRGVFDKVGGFDIRLGVGQWFGSGEETDLVLRTLRAGIPIGYEHGAHVHHPVKRFDESRKALKAIRSRARGTGAVYAVHKVPRLVVARGLLSPLVRSLAAPWNYRHLFSSFLECAGRLEGWLAWRLRQRRAAHLHAPAHLLSNVPSLSAAPGVSMDAGPS